MSIFWLYWCRQTDSPDYATESCHWDRCNSSLMSAICRWALTFLSVMRSRYTPFSLIGRVLVQHDLSYCSLILPVQPWWAKEAVAVKWQDSAGKSTRGDQGQAMLYIRSVALVKMHCRDRCVACDQADHGWNCNVFRMYIHVASRFTRIATPI